MRFTTDEAFGKLLRMRRLRIAMAQMNPVVGDIRGNAGKIARWCEKAKKLGSSLVLFPELAVTGYPPEDLLLKPRFIRDNINAMRSLAKKVRGITAVIGFVDGAGDDIFNAAAIVHNGRVAAVYHKMLLPNYGVFDEKRYFRAGNEPLNFVLAGVRIGVEICEDIWYASGPARAQAAAGAEVIVNINASPYYMGRALQRERMLKTRSRENGVFIAYNNTVGGQDELVFDGQGMILGPDARVIARGAAFEEDLVTADLELGARARRPGSKTGVREVVLKGASKAAPSPLPAKKGARKKVDIEEEVLKALVMGTRDYVRKNGFRHVVIGLSGGIDSSLVAAVAARALGPKNITGVMMPSGYTSRASVEDAAELAKNLGIETMTVPVERTFRSYLRMLKKAFGKAPPGITEENLQARVRGNTLMALSNKFGWLVLTTGNKSEMSVGYATLYGDMAGGFAVIKDVPKTLVYSITRKINDLDGRDVIPQRVLTKAPTAELKPDQTDQDTLPPYEVLDPILKAYVEEDKSLDEIVAMGFKKSLVKKVTSMVDHSEYKRRQAPPGIKITQRAFGKDRRMPITNGYDHGSFGP